MNIGELKRILDTESGGDDSKEIVFNNIVDDEYEAEEGHFILMEDEDKVSKIHIYSPCCTDNQ
jgi:hypothetical protein